MVSDINTSSWGNFKGINHKGHEGSQRTAIPSELARVFFGPAFDDYFLFGIELDGVAALSVQNAEETVFPSAEREIGHGRGYADVDSDIAGGSFITEAPRCCTARGK